MDTDSDQAEKRPLDAAVERQAETMHKIGEALKSEWVNPEDLKTAVSETEQASEEVKRALNERKQSPLEEHLGSDPKNLD